MSEQRRLAAIISADVEGYLRLKCPFLALLRSADRAWKRPMLGVDLT